MPSVGFELTISAGEPPKTYALDRAATGTGTGSCEYSHVNAVIYGLPQRQLYLQLTRVLKLSPVSFILTAFQKEALLPP
jgi:hypothetical protein